MRLDKKVALVTGAAKGIGRAIALKLSSEGAYIIVNYRGSEDKAKETLELIKSLNGDGEIYKCDVSRYEDSKQMIDYILEKHSKLDILVNNAGITKDNLLMKMSEEEFDKVIESNLKSAFNCMQLVSRPEKYKVIVTMNLYGDILSDLVAGLVGGLGVAPGANIGDDIAIFEAVHGSAPDIAGQNKANPLALLLSSLEMLKYLKLNDFAENIENAILKTLEEGCKTKDLGGNATTTEFTKKIIENLG